ncbi:hypothetical protein CLPUN_51750 [Clostridium puniceum]|uniref:Uncharacterized protein n=1 Tax=Clostridium puniceum TaxID=29367 RepID=A0A1S8SYW3_9CLOT|nr:hypothetical protein [Clostridium puniceum]OOM70710.1 hypothetical protein CLPUN_51750 [Clostridium puniceum]
MEIYIYKTYEEWFDDKPTEIIEGDVNSIYNGVLVINTVIDHKSYRQIFSLKNNFAVIYKLSYGFLSYAKEINIYSSIKSWQNSTPEISFMGEVCENECGDSHFVFIAHDGFKQSISLDGIYAVTYER